MGATVSRIFNCPKCGAHLSSGEKPKKCLNCGYSFNQSEADLTKEFNWGKSPFTQLYELVQQDMEKYMDKPIHELIPTITKEQADDLVVSNALRLKFIQGKRQVEMNEFFATSSLVELENWLESLIGFFQVAHLSSNKERILKSLALAIRLGKYAENLEKLIQSGATFYERPNKAPTERSGQ